jgi:hypothetical protein
MFGDPATNPKGWPQASLEELFEIARGGSPRPIDDYIYFYALLGTQAVYAEFARRAPGAAVKNLNIDLVRGVTVPVPPLPAQKKFAAIVASIEGRASTYNRALTECDALFTSIQHRAFQGEL